MLSPLASLAQSTLQGIARGANAASSAFASLLPESPAHDAATSTTVNASSRIETLEKSLRRKLDEFYARITPRLRESAVNRVSPIVLTPDGFGGVHVDVDHPQFATIETMFEQDPTLRHELHEITAIANELHATTYHEPLRETSISVTLGADGWSLATPASVFAADSPLRMQNGMPTP